MTQEEKDKFIVGKWYKDCTGDFVEFKRFSDDVCIFTAFVRGGEYCNRSNNWCITAFQKCTPMTINEMKHYLPKSEWWIETNNDLFPIY